MSGTSVDGVDAALVEIREHGLETQIELLAFHSHPFDRQKSEIASSISSKQRQAVLTKSVR